MPGASMSMVPACRGSALDIVVSRGGNVVLSCGVVRKAFEGCFVFHYVSLFIVHM